MSYLTLEQEFAIIDADAKSRELMRAQIAILSIQLDLARGAFVGFESRKRLSDLLAKYPQFNL